MYLTDNVNFNVLCSDHLNLRNKKKVSFDSHHAYYMMQSHKVDCFPLCLVTDVLNKIYNKDVYAVRLLFSVNVALHKPAYQHHPAYPGFDKYDASNAVDGHRSDLRWDGGQCVVSAGSGTATWWVNLTSIYSIHHITIYYRTEASIWGILNLIEFRPMQSVENTF